MHYTGSIEYWTQSYFGYKYKGRQFAWIQPHRKTFDVGAHVIDERGQITGYEPLRINKTADIDSESYKKILEKITEAFKKVGGEHNTGLLG